MEERHLFSCPICNAHHLFFAEEDGKKNRCCECRKVFTVDLVLRRRKMYKKTFMKITLEAMADDANFFGVLMNTGELIINKSENFDEKFEYYMDAYNHKMQLSKAPHIRIVNAAYADNVGYLLEALKF